MKNTKRKIYVVGSSVGYANWMQGELVRRMEDADLVLFTGGEDVDPSLYGEAHHPLTGSNLTRDEYEMAEFNKARKLNKKLIGICRGAQFLCAMSGGILVQHQENRHWIHEMLTSDNKKLAITSTHHQAQYPWTMPAEDYKVIGWSVGLSRFHEGGNREELPMTKEKEVEIVYYPKTNALGIQSHPECMFGSNEPQCLESIRWHRELLDKHMEGTI